MPLRLDGRQSLLFFGGGNGHSHVPRCLENLVQAERFISLLLVRKKFLSACRCKYIAFPHLPISMSCGKQTDVQMCWCIIGHYDNMDFQQLPESFEQHKVCTVLKTPVITSRYHLSDSIQLLITWPYAAHFNGSTPGSTGRTGSAHLYSLHSSLSAKLPSASLGRGEKNLEFLLNKKPWCKRHTH